MKKLITGILLPFIFLSAAAQSGKQDPVHWTFSVKKTSEKAAEIQLTVTMDNGWHIYSQTQPAEAIAVPTKLVFTKNPLVVIKGPAQELGEKETYNDKIAGIVQYQYGGKVEFIQSITLKSTAKTSLSVAVTYQACTSEMCLPPKTTPLTIPVE